MGIAIITGGSSGLGAALCEQYVSRGWKVIEFSRSAPHPFSVELDMADTGDTGEVFERTFGSLAALDCDEIVAINNAAVLAPVGPSALADPAAVLRSVDVNVTAGIMFASEFLRAFQLQDCVKTFVNISSGAAGKAHAGWSLYSAGKAAMEHYCRVLAVEQSTQHTPVRVFSINPGVMDTSMQAEVRASDPAHFPELDRFVGLKRDGLLVSPDHVAMQIVDIVQSRPEPGVTYAVSR